jgi:3-oxoacyl-[acyl-carrier-protein] synthase-3
MVGIAGISYSLGSDVIDNTELATSMGLAPDWFVRRTGTKQRRVYGEGEDFLSLSVDALRKSCEEAGIDPAMVGPETLVLYVQSGLQTHLVPPQAIVLAQRAGFKHAKVLGIDGSCAEVIPALDTAVRLMEAGRCERVIVVAGVETINMIDPQDLDTVGLFGVGASAIVLTTDARTDLRFDLCGSYWESHVDHWELGTMAVRSREFTKDGIEIQTGYYDMKGTGLVRKSVALLPAVVDKVLAEAGWLRDDLDLVVLHQPNVRFVDMVVRAIGVAPDIVPVPGAEHGNMGPASILVSLALAKEAGELKPSGKVLMVSFGVGFSCGAAAISL